MDFVCVSIRVPKSGSESLRRLLTAAFSGKQIFYLPSTVDRDGALSRLQRLRFHRARFKNLISHYRSPFLGSAYAFINKHARNGDLITGGHIGFADARAAIRHPIKMIAILRDPVQRAISDYNYARAAFLARNPMRRPTAGTLPAVAGRRDFDGYLDFLEEHRDLYGNPACRYTGWDGRENLSEFCAKNVFHIGILEQRQHFADELGRKMRKTLSFPHLNRSVGETVREPTAAQRSRLERIFARDFTLYEWVRQNC